MANLLVMSHPDPEIQYLIDRLRVRTDSLRVIHERTGLGWHWLRAFAEARIKNPGYGKIKRLTEYLDTAELKNGDRPSPGVAVNE